MTGKSPPKIGYVISMKSGIHSFVFRELKELANGGLLFVLYPIMLGQGPYMPEANWKVHRFNTFSLARGLVRVLLRNPKSFLVALADAARFGAFLDLAVAIDFSDNMDNEGITRVHCHFGDHKLFVGYFCGILLGLPVSVTIHAYELYNNPNPRFFRRILSRVDEVITVSDFNRKVLEAKYRVRNDNIHVIRLFTDKGLDEDISYSLGDPFTVLTVSRFVEKKGHRTLFQAVARLKDKNLRLQVVGGGPLSLKPLARRMNIESKVVFLGKVSDDELRRLYRECDVFCLPSETPDSGDREGIPVALMEAMAYGKPVIATRHAGIPELVQEILIDERNSEALAEGIVDLMKDEDLRRRLGQRNRDIIREKYSSKNVNALLEIFRRDRA